MHGMKRNERIEPSAVALGFLFYKEKRIIMIFDTHTHYDDGQFNKDREQLLLGMQEAGVGAIVNVGATMQGAKDSVAMAKQYPFMYAAVGIHPESAKDLNEEEFEVLRNLAKEEKVVAIGEIGLDYYWDSTEPEVQKYWFLRQLALAKEVDLPIIIHSRDAAGDTYDILKEEYKKSGNLFKGVIHCFSYSLELAKEFIKMGFFIGIGGVATFQNGRKLKEVIEGIPLECMVLETDCPYLAPVPFRGKRNSSEKLTYVVSAIAQIKGVSEEEVERITWENAQKLYQMK